MRNHARKSAGTGGGRVAWLRSRLPTVAARIAIFLMLFLLHTGLGTAAPPPPRATAGVIDVTGWDFATPPELLQQKAAAAQIHAAILGSLGVLGLHFLLLFGLRRHERGSLFFGLLALTLALRSAVVHDLILTQLPAGYGWELHQKIFFITQLMLQAVAVQLAAVLFPQEASPKATRVITLLSLLGIGLTLAVPARVHTELLFALIASGLIVLVYTALVAVRAAIRRRPDSALALCITIAFGLSIGEEAARNFGLPIALSWLAPLLWLLLLVTKTVLYARDYAQLVDRQGALLAQNSQLNSSLKTHLSELRSTRRLLSAQEEELRRRIAEFLHGRVQLKLLVAEQQLAVARDQLTPDQSETAALMAHVQVQLDIIRHQDIRLASHLLHPTAVSAGLRSALYTLAAEYQGRFTTHLEADAAIAALDDPRRNQISEPVRLTAYRALSEALANVAAHAGAPHVQVRLSRNSAGALEIEVRDNGCGFETDRITPGLGLRTIAARLAECDGSLTITSSPGQGTRLHLTIPLGERDPHADSSLVAGELP